MSCLDIFGVKICRPVLISVKTEEMKRRFCLTRCVQVARISGNVLLRRSLCEAPTWGERVVGWAEPCAGVTVLLFVS